MREFVIYRGEKFWLQSTDRYFQSGSKKAPERLLHRRIWIDNFGPIPPGFEVHHQDEDWRNNAPTNLVLKVATEHRREHMLKRMADPEARAAAIQTLRDNSDKAAAWHDTPEGRAWHAANSKQAWAKKPVRQMTCTVCAKPYEAFFESRSRFCSHNCEQYESYRRHKTAVGECAQCGADFTYNKFKIPAQECCSRGCGIRRRLGHPFKSYLA